MNQSAEDDKNAASVTNSDADALELPDVFEGLHFYLHSKSLQPDEERLIRRLVVAFGG